MLCFYQALAFRTALSHLKDCDPTEALEKQEKDAQLAYEKGTKACVICHPLQMISMIICSCSRFSSKFEQCATIPMDSS